MLRQRNDVARSGLYARAYRSATPPLYLTVVSGLKCGLGLRLHA